MPSIRKDLHWSKHLNAFTVFTMLQWFVMMLLNAMVIPLSIAHLFHLTAQETSLFLSNTFFFVGLFSLIQVLFGHKLPIIDGPAGIWWGVIFITFQINSQLGMDKLLIGQGLELGFIAVGVYLYAMGICRLTGKISALFSPLVNGVFMLIMPFSMSGTLLKGMLGLDSATSFNGKIAVSSILLFVFILFISRLKRIKWISSFSLLIGIVMGWLLFLLLGFRENIVLEPLFSYPTLFFWGMPQLDWGILSVTFITGFIMLAHVTVSIQSMALVSKKEISSQVYDSTSKISGISYVLTGLSGVIGLLPLASSSSVVSLSGVFSRVPFILASILMISLGFFRGMSNILSSIPEPVIYTVLFILFIQLVEIGFKFFELIEMNSKQLFIISFSLLLGMGVMFLPPSFIQLFHPVVGNIVGNGLVVAILCSVLLEQSFNLSKRWGEPKWQMENFKKRWM
ncbi:purine/pyrimidine permease [Ammoniphilus sp. YIM 78166]|uniref:purine/pyrimidine permease n=1 Tax=Ammoniphilus sp. YIM 78166 TaxID=1644106 RepID=UPI00106FA3F0|nr:purine/pyrimidine permease [Ammoniphilus sp. YIM 78166]